MQRTLFIYTLRENLVEIIKLNFLKTLYIVKMPRKMKSNLAYSYDTNDVVTPTLQPSFQKMKTGSIFEFNRPAFRANTNPIRDPIKDFDMSTLNRRGGIGNNTIIRQNFLAPDPAARSAYDFEIQDKIRRQQEGLNVKLSDKTISDLFKVVTVDPSDKEWLNEYNRRLGAGETEEQLKAFPPLGRPQRPLTKMVNFAEASNVSSLNLTQKLDLLLTAVKSAPSVVDPAKILADIWLVVDNIEKFSDTNFEALAAILRKSGAVDRDPRVYFGARYHRFWSRRQYLESKAKVDTFILANNTTGSASRPLVGTLGDPVKLESLITTLGLPREKILDDSGDDVTGPGDAFYFDIVNLSIIDYDDVCDQVNTGIDSGLIDDQPPPAGYAGMWLTEEDIRTLNGIDVG
jgi:hypothetical protein